MVEVKLPQSVKELACRKGLINRRRFQGSVNTAFWKGWARGVGRPC